MTTPAVVKIEGDSSHLQAALKASAQAMKAVEAETAAMGKQFESATAEVGKTADALNNKLGGAKSGGLAATKAEATKLTDMLKQVAKDADLAAGSIVDGLGGVTAIKAAGAVGLAVTGVVGALTNFNDAATSAFMRYGEEGEAAANKVNTAFYELTGVFADALVGQQNVAQAGDMLAGAWNNVKDAATFALTPIKLLSEAFFALTGSADDNTGALDDNAAALRALQKMQGQGAADVAKAQSGLDAAARTANEMLGNTIALRKADFEEKQKGMKLELEGAKTIAVSDLTMKKFQDTLQRMRDGKNLKPSEAMMLVMGRGADGEILPELRDKIMAKAFAEANEELSDNASLLAALKPEQRDQIALIQQAIDLKFEDKLAEEQRAQAIKDADAAERARNAARRAARTERPAPELGAEGDIVSNYGALKATAEAYDIIGIAIRDATFESDELGNHLIQTNAMEQAMLAARGAVYLATNAAIVESDKEANKQMQDAQDKRMAATATATYKSMMLQIGAGVTLADAARAAIGSVVTALGDEFMIRSGASFISGNAIAGAGFLALAGGAYALGGSLGSKKGPAAETPPTAAQSYEKTENVTYSLRVDAAFADGESIARRFAQMHQGAQQRGLIAVPA